MSSKSLSVALGLTALLVVAQTASAHPGHGPASGFHAGFYHPLSGIDHILAMVAVGLCAGQLGGRWIWFLPATFLGFMVAGGIVAIGGTHVPMIEQGIAASVLILGLLVAGGSRLFLPLTVGLVALFAMFHGYAHGAEMQSGLRPTTYALGFVLATAALHAIGVGIGIVLKRRSWTTASRITGGAIAAGGLLLFLM